MRDPQKIRPIGSPVRAVLRDSHMRIQDSLVGLHERKCVLLFAFV
ncbi:hypothetical protein Hoch_4404 [Haliangium ochraceum DSM 14365]|uniref:Uncharacterized protein n=1 Tax=Haliangium ochraceum (strain DSM 14365 / JCM 11303 / SMP-2) TaxID=502025 RepID=D0LNJ3_HALO1|nr:hypothetical protein Hoch_4404 [Haliangium ochraceum DSM 14365]